MLVSGVLSGRRPATELQCSITNVIIPWPIDRGQNWERKGWVEILHVDLREGESQEGLLARFQAMIRRSGVLNEVKSHRFFISKSEKARIAARKAARRRARRNR
ncbi:MAG: 30S ribosomal protein S21 [Chloroflexota bacterium]